MAANVVAREVSIVVVGSFNPAILHPLWFSSQKLIKRGEAEAAEIELVHREMALWHTEWFKINVAPDRLQLRCEQEAYFEPVRDLAMGVLMLLEHTPVRAIGINWAAHVQFSDAELYERFGHELVPKARWEGVVRQPKTARVAVTGPHEDGRRNAPIWCTGVKGQAATRLV